MGFRTTWLLAFVAVAAVGLAGVLEWLSPALAIWLTGVTLLVVIGLFHRRHWRMRTRALARQADERRALADKLGRTADRVRQVADQANARLDPVVAEQTRQAAALRRLQDAQLEAKRANSTSAAATTPSAGERVLIWRGPAQLDLNLELDLLIATELEARGAEVTMVLCDGASGCLQRRDDIRFGADKRGLTDDWEARCQRCFADRGLDELRELGVPFVTFNGAVDAQTRDRFRALADDSSRDDIVDFVHRGMKVGHWAASSTIRYFVGVDPMAHPRFLPMLREYFYTALLSAEAAWTIFEQHAPTRIVMQHGIYVEWGPAFELAGQRQIPVTRWCRGYSYRGHHWFVKTSDPTDRRHPHHAPEHHWRKRSRQPLTQVERQRLQRYMEAQPLKQNNRYVLFDPQSSAAEVRDRLGLPDDKPVFAVFCHLSWDAQYGFEEQTDGHTFRQWLEDTVATAIATDDVHWLIKVHPAEKLNHQEVGCQEFITEQFGALPAHVRVLPADTDINTYDLLPLLDGVVTIFGTAGLEAAILGKTVIPAGHAHYGAKGFTIDSPSRSDYIANLAAAASLPAPTPVQVDIARRYAYDYFVSRQLPFDASAAYRERKRGELAPRRKHMLDKWAEAILGRDRFAMSEDEVEACERFPEVPGSPVAHLDWAGSQRAVASDEPTPAARPLTGAFG